MLTKRIRLCSWPHIFTLCRQKQHPITLSPEPTQRQQRYLVRWLSKCSLQRVRSYSQAISQADNSPTPRTTPLSSICSPRWPHSSSHSWRQKVPRQRQKENKWRNVNPKQSFPELRDSRTSTWQSISWQTGESHHVFIPAAKQRGRYLIKISKLMNANALWWCEKRNPTRGPGFSLWICQSAVSTRASAPAEDPQGRASTNCSFYRIKVSDTKLAAHELSSSGANHIYKDLCLQYVSVKGCNQRLYLSLW